MRRALEQVVPSLLVFQVLLENLLSAWCCGVAKGQDRRSSHQRPQSDHSTTGPVGGLVQWWFLSLQRGSPLPPTEARLKERTKVSQRHSWCQPLKRKAGAEPELSAHVNEHGRTTDLKKFLARDLILSAVLDSSHPPMKAELLRQRCSSNRFVGVQQLPEETLCLDH